MTSLLANIALSSVLALPSPIAAHTEGEDYVFLKFLEGSIEGHFEVHFDDLQEKLGLAVETGDRATETVVATAASVHAYIAEHFEIGPAGAEPYVLEFTRQGSTTVPEGTFGQYFFRVDVNPLPDELDIFHSMFYAEDKLHRGLVCVEYNVKTDTEYPGEYTALVFSPTNSEQTLDLNAIPSIMGPWDMIPQGVWHIWIGIDHILFLLALMLPAVLVLRDGAWKPVDTFPIALLNLLKIVTVFTIAHSVTLLLAALDFISLPSRVVESVIALSIILVALNNIFGKVRQGSLWVILFLGLFHGLGFASVMGHLPFRMGDLVKIVIGFNIGVELGQVVIVAAVFPVLFWLRRSGLYMSLMMRGLSAVLALIAAWWFVERAFGFG